jgi:hypothetical protein
MPREVEIEERMKPHFIAMFTVTSLVASVALGDIYYDAEGDIATGNPNLDITSFEVDNDGTNLSMSLTVSNLDADWGNYMVFMDILGMPDNYNGSGDNDNPWFRDVGGLEGTDIFVGSWAGGGGGMQYWEFYDSGWNQPDTTYSMSIDWATSTITWDLFGFVTAMENMGVDTIGFEVATTGGNGGDPAIDLLGGEGTQPGWGGGSTSTDLMYYQIPAPGTLALLLVAGIARRRRS